MPISWAMWAIGRRGWAAIRPTRVSLPAGVSRALAWAMRPPVSACRNSPHLTRRPHLTSTTSMGRTPRPDGDLGAGAEGGRQPPAHRGHAPTTGRRRAGGSHVPGAGAGLAGAASRGSRRADYSTEANNREPPRIMTAWVGRLELWPAA